MKLVARMRVVPFLCGLFVLGTSSVVECVEKPSTNRRGYITLSELPNLGKLEASNTTSPIGTVAAKAPASTKAAKEFATTSYEITRYIAATFASAARNGSIVNVVDDIKPHLENMSKGWLYAHDAPMMRRYLKCYDAYQAMNRLWGTVHWINPRLAYPGAYEAVDNLSATLATCRNRLGLSGQD